MLCFIEHRAEHPIYRLENHDQCRCSVNELHHNQRRISPRKQAMQRRAEKSEIARYVNHPECLETDQRRR